MSDLTFHCDNGAIILPPKPELTREGFLRAYLRIARTGDLKYRNPDNSERIERVTPEVLFNPDSMDSFAAKPITLLHPPKGIEVTPDNAATYQKGLLGHFPVQDGEFLGFGATITHRDAIDAVLSKQIKQVSSGYLVRVQKRSDAMYDQVWRDGNHAAIVPLGRAGKEVSFVLDAEEEGENNASWIWQIDAVGDDYFTVSDAAIEAFKELQPKLIFDLAKGRKQPIRKDKNPMTQLLIGKKLIRFDTDDAATLDNLQSEVAAIVDRADKAEADLNATQLKLDAANAQVETLTKERDALQAKVDAATETKADEAEPEIKADASELKERLQLIREVSPFLASELPEFKEDALYDLNPTQIKTAYLAVKRPDLKERIDSASEDYISAFYDAQKPEPTKTGRAGSSRVDDILSQIAPADAREDMGGFGEKKKSTRAERIAANGRKSMGMDK